MYIYIYTLHNYHIHIYDMCVGVKKMFKNTQVENYKTKVQILLL